jgi:hypothetical protein
MVKGAVNSIDSNAINPMAWVLGPVQNAIGDMLVPLRTVQHIFTWEEPAATTFIYNALGAVTLLAALIPWWLVLPFLIRWVSRLVVIGLFGPHMYFVGRHFEHLEDLERQQQEAQKREEEQSKAARSSRSSQSSTTQPTGEDASSSSAAAGAASSSYVFEMESPRNVPRQPCRPAARKALAVRTPRAAKNESRGAKEETRPSSNTPRHSEMGRYSSSDHVAHDTTASSAGSRSSLERRGKPAITSPCAVGPALDS